MANDGERRFLRSIARWIGTFAGTVEGVAIVGEQSINPPQDRGQHNHEVRFEDSDINARGTFLTGVGVFVGMWIVIGLLFFYFSFLNHHETAISPPPIPIAEHGAPLPPEPRLQSAPAEDLKTLRAEEHWELTHYYWIDKAKGAVAIPIDRAMQIVAQRGIPPQKAPPGLVLSQPQAGTRLTGFEGKVEPEPR